MTAKPPAHDDFLTTEEVLEYLQVNFRTLDTLRRAGAIDAVNLRVAGCLTTPLRDTQVLEAAVRALGAPAA